ncbi:MAG: hypothetical protein R2845_02800 [Thermomicrobiales bacterium]
MGVDLRHRKHERAVAHGMPGHRDRAIEHARQQFRIERGPRFADRDDASLIDEGQPIGPGGREIDIVQDRHHGATRGRNLAGDFHHHLLVTEIERGSRFVEQQDG